MRINKLGKWFYTVLSLLVLVILMYFYLEPSISEFLKSVGNYEGMNFSVTESMERGVFLNEYQVSPNPIQISDGKSIGLDQVWTEQFWRYKEGADGIRIMSEEMIYLCLIFNEGDINFLDKKFNYTWEFRLVDSISYHSLFTEDYVRYLIKAQDVLSNNLYLYAEVEDTLNKRNLITKLKLLQKK